MRINKQANSVKHGLNFTDAHLIFDFPMYVVNDDREEYGEIHYQGIGFLNGKCVVVVFSELDHATIRLISLRKATRQERRIYERET